MTLADPHARADVHARADGLATHSGAIVIDGTCPGEHWREAYASWASGGASACVVSVAAWESCRETMDRLGQVFRLVRQSDELSLATDTAGIRDDLIKAIAGSGGVIGVNGFPAFVADTTAPTLVEGELSAAAVALSERTRRCLRAAEPDSAATAARVQ